MVIRARFPALYHGIIEQTSSVADTGPAEDEEEEEDKDVAEQEVSDVNGLRNVAAKRTLQFKMTQRYHFYNEHLWLWGSKSTVPLRVSASSREKASFPSTLNRCCRNAQRGMWRSCYARLLVHRHSFHNIHHF